MDRPPDLVDFVNVHYLCARTLLRPEDVLLAVMEFVVNQYPLFLRQRHCHVRHGAILPVRVAGR